MKIFGIVLAIIIVVSIVLIFSVGRKAIVITNTEKSLNTATGAGFLSVGVQSPGNTVVVSSATLPKPGFVVIETVGSRVDEIIGISQLLPIGTQNNLLVNLSKDVKGIKLSGSLWKDNGDGIFNAETDEWVKDEKTGLRVFQYFDVKTR